jgi:hypothetical protein
LGRGSLKALATPCMAAPARHGAMESERHYFTLRQIHRILSVTFSMLLVQASEHRTSGGSPSLVTVSIPSGIEAEHACPVHFETPARLRRNISALPPSPGPRTCRNARFTSALKKENSGADITIPWTDRYRFLKSCATRPGTLYIGYVRTAQAKAQEPSATRLTQPPFLSGRLTRAKGCWTASLNGDFLLIKMPSTYFRVVGRARSKRFVLA